MTNFKTCILHIGAPKTGSTALEKFLSHNRDSLNRHGWKYPDVNLRGYGHHDLAFLIDGAYPKWATPQNKPLEALVQNLLNEAAESDRIMLSSENFYLYPQPEKTRDMLAQAGFPAETVKIIVYVRRQDEMHLSWYNQAVKAQGYSKSIHECVCETRELWNYESALNTWADAFGRETIIIRPYEPETLVEGDVRIDFLKLAGLPPEDFAWPQDTINTRINRDILEFQRLVNRLPLPVQEKRRFHRELIALTEAAAPLGLFDDSPLLTPAQRREILRSYADSNMRTARTFLGRDHLFNNERIDEPRISEATKGLTLEKLSYILGWILSKQNRSADV